MRTCSLLLVALACLASTAAGKYVYLSHDGAATTPANKLAIAAAKAACARVNADNNLSGGAVWEATAGTANNSLTAGTGDLKAVVNVHPLAADLTALKTLANSNSVPVIQAVRGPSHACDEEVIYAAGVPSQLLAYVARWAPTFYQMEDPINRAGPTDPHPNYFLLSSGAGQDEAMASGMENPGVGAYVTGDNSYGQKIIEEEVQYRGGFFRGHIRLDEVAGCTAGAVTVACADKILQAMDTKYDNFSTDHSAANYAKLRDSDTNGAHPSAVVFSTLTSKHDTDILYTQFLLHKDGEANRPFYLASVGLDDTNRPTPDVANNGLAYFSTYRTQGVGKELNDDDLRFQKDLCTELASDCDNASGRIELVEGTSSATFNAAAGQAVVDNADTINVGQTFYDLLSAGDEVTYHAGSGTPITGLVDQTSYLVKEKASGATMIKLGAMADNAQMDIQGVTSTTGYFTHHLTDSSGISAEAHAVYAGIVALAQAEFDLAAAGTTTTKWKDADGLRGEANSFRVKAPAGALTLGTNNHISQVIFMSRVGCDTDANGDPVLPCSWARETIGTSGQPYHRNDPSTAESADPSLRGQPHMHSYTAFGFTEAITPGSGVYTKPASLAAGGNKRILKVNLCNWVGTLRAAKIETDVHRVGIMHSLTGTMQISERTVVDADLMAIDQLNAAGGLKGFQIMPTVIDGESGFGPGGGFDIAAKQLTHTDFYGEDTTGTTVFGCWTSVSRKRVLPTFQDSVPGTTAGTHKAQLWYPVQYEGNECSKNVFYTGQDPTQQILPGLDYLLSNFGPKIYVVASNYVFPRTASQVIKNYMERYGGQLMGEMYVGLGDSTDVKMWKIQAMVDDITHKLDHYEGSIFNTLNFDANVIFFQKLFVAGYTGDKAPVMSVSIGEPEVASMNAGGLLLNQLVSWGYFHTIESSSNFRWIANFQNMHGGHRVMSDPMECAYDSVIIWSKAVELSDSFDVDEIRPAVIGITIDAPSGSVAIGPNHHLAKKARIGKVRADGLLDIVMASPFRVTPRPWSDFMPSSLQFDAVFRKTAAGDDDWSTATVGTDGWANTDIDKCVTPTSRKTAATGTWSMDNNVYQKPANTNGTIPGQMLGSSKCTEPIFGWCNSDAYSPPHNAGVHVRVLVQGTDAAHTTSTGTAATGVVTLGAPTVTATPAGGSARPPATPTACTKVNTSGGGGVVTATAHGFVVADTVVFQNIVGMVELNVAATVFKVKAVTTDTFTLGQATHTNGFDTSGFGTFVDTSSTAHSKIITAATNASPGVFTAATHGLSVGNAVTFSDIAGMTELNGLSYTVGTVPSANTFTLKNAAGTVAINTSSGFGTFAANIRTQTRIQLPASATSTITNRYNGHRISFTSGTGANQEMTITAYDGATHVVTWSGNETPGGADTTYSILDIDLGGADTGGSGADEAFQPEYHGAHYAVGAQYIVVDGDVSAGTSACNGKAGLGWAINTVLVSPDGTDIGTVASVTENFETDTASWFSSCKCTVELKKTGSNALTRGLEPASATTPWNGILRNDTTLRAKAGPPTAYKCYDYRLQDNPAACTGDWAAMTAVVDVGKHPSFTATKPAGYILPANSDCEHTGPPQKDKKDYNKNYGCDWKGKADGYYLRDDVEHIAFVHNLSYPGWYADQKDSGTDTVVMSHDKANSLTQETVSRLTVQMMYNTVTEINLAGGVNGKEIMVIPVDQAKDTHVMGSSTMTAMASAMSNFPNTIAYMNCDDICQANALAANPSTKSLLVNPRPLAGGETCNPASVYMGASEADYTSLLLEYTKENAVFTKIGVIRLTGSSATAAETGSTAAGLTAAELVELDVAANTCTSSDSDDQCAVKMEAKAVTALTSMQTKCASGCPIYVAIDNTHKHEIDAVLGLYKAFYNQKMKAAKTPLLTFSRPTGVSATLLKGHLSIGSFFGSLPLAQAHLLNLASESVWGASSTASSRKDILEVVEANTSSISLIMAGAQAAQSFDTIEIRRSLYDLTSASLPRGNNIRLRLDNSLNTPLHVAEFDRGVPKLLKSMLGPTGVVAVGQATLTGTPDAEPLGTCDHYPYRDNECDVLMLQGCRAGRNECSQYPQFDCPANSERFDNGVCPAPPCTQEIDFFLGGACCPSDEVACNIALGEIRSADSMACLICDDLEDHITTYANTCKDCAGEQTGNTFILYGAGATSMICFFVMLYVMKGEAPLKEEPTHFDKVLELFHKLDKSAKTAQVDRHKFRSSILELGIEEAWVGDLLNAAADDASTPSLIKYSGLVKALHAARKERIKLITQNVKTGEGRSTALLKMAKAADGDGAMEAANAAVARVKGKEHKHRHLKDAARLVEMENGIIDEIDDEQEEREEMEDAEARAEGREVKKHRKHRHHKHKRKHGGHKHKHHHLKDAAHQVELQNEFIEEIDVKEKEDDTRKKEKQGESSKAKRGGILKGKGSETARSALSSGNWSHLYLTLRQVASFLQIVSSINFTLPYVGFPQLFRDLIKRLTFINLDISFALDFLPVLDVSECEIGNNQAMIIAHLSIFPMWYICFYLAEGWLSLQIKLCKSRKRKYTWASATCAGMQLLLGVYFIMFPGLVSRSFMGFKSVEPMIMWVSFVSIFFYCIILPWKLIRDMSRVHHLLVIPKHMTPSEKLALLNDHKHHRARRKYGSLFAQYERQFWWFELVSMAHKALLVGIVHLYDNETTRCRFLVAASCGYFVLMVVTAPLQEDIDDVLQLAMQVVTISIYVAAYELQSRGANAKENKALGYALVSVTCAVVLFAITILLSTMSSNFRRKFAEPLARCFKPCLKRIVKAKAVVSCFEKKSSSVVPIGEGEGEGGGEARWDESETWTRFEHHWSGLGPCWVSDKTGVRSTTNPYLSRKASLQMLRARQDEEMMSGRTIGEDGEVDPEPKWL